MYDPLTGARLVTREMSESMTFRMNRPAARKLRQAAAASGKSLSAFARDALLAAARSAAGAPSGDVPSGGAPQTRIGD